MNIKAVKTAPASAVAKSISQLPEAPASLVLEEPRVVITKTEPQTTPTPEPAVVSIGSLKSIREKIARENNQAIVKSRPLETESLTECWKQYTALLKKKKLHSTVTNFNMARLEVLDENCFQVLVANAMQQKFIEVERAGLIEHLMQFFNNRNITYKLIQNEAEADDATEAKPLNSKQRYQLMVEQYPNIKLLKDRIRLELDF